MESETAHLSAQEIEEYRRRTLGAAARRRCDTHVAACQRCLAQVLGEENSTLAFMQLSEAFTLAEEEPFHLSVEDLKRYVSKHLDEADRTIFESHLENCQECSEAHVAYLARTSREDSATHILSEQVHKDRSSLAGRSIRSWGNWRWPFLTPLRLIGAAVVAVSVLMFWVAWRYKSDTHSIDQAHQGSLQPALSTALLRLKDGSGEVTIDQTGGVHGLEWLSAPSESAVIEALNMPELSKPQILTDLFKPSIKFMGKRAGHPPFALIGPLAEVIAEDQPTLRWNVLSGANSYVVSVFDAQFQKVMESPRLTTTEWKLPAPLGHGVTYSWQVAAFRGSQQMTAPVAPAPRAEFRVLDTGALEGLKAVRAQNPNAHLTLGVLYARAGLLNDAEREFQALVKENPESDVAGKLLRSVQVWQHQTKVIE